MVLFFVAKMVTQGRVASLDKIMNDMRRHQKLQQQSSLSQRQQKRTPSAEKVNLSTESVTTIATSVESLAPAALSSVVTTTTPSPSTPTTSTSSVTVTSNVTVTLNGATMSSDENLSLPVAQISENIATVSVNDLDVQVSSDNPQ